MGVSETWFCVDIQKVQIFKGLSDIAWDIHILINGVHLQNQQDKGGEKITNNFFSQKIIA